MIDEMNEKIASTAEVPLWTTTDSANEEAPAAAPASTTTALSIIVPTRNEAGNIGELVRRLTKALPAGNMEIIFVDDSDDDTPATIQQTTARAGCDIRLVHRAPGERKEGLGGAVMEGLRAARSPWSCVMDGDLQHPPELVPQMIDRALTADADLVIASRYTEHGSVGNFNLLREAISHFSTTAARVMFPRRLRNVSDPMSGFFLIRKEAIDVDRLRPRGFKILLEILVRNPKARVAEVGFEFGERLAGQSKADLREGLRYLSHLWRLRFDGNPLFGQGAFRFLQFVTVGASGILVNSLALAAFTEVGGLYYLVSLALATQVSSLWNFALSEAWVFNYRQQSQGRLKRLVMFLLMNNAALALRGPMVYGLTSLLGMHYLVSNLISLAVLTTLRYAVADTLIWKRDNHMSAKNTVYSYDIHGIVSVTSEVALPELERFMTTAAGSEANTEPTIRVMIGNVRQARQRNMAAPEEQHIFYSEGPASAGFAIDVLLGETIEVVASPLLRHSPHVLYTNVVEPILRWTFVKKGYALVHAACIAFGEDAYLVTARTDTGKTTTILRILSAQAKAAANGTSNGHATGAFISDDLTLLSPQGRVMTYPKPLTISHHTLRAVDSRTLTHRERFGLYFQSRIHSRDGRKFAFRLTQSKLPVATINMLTQWIVPPPKYHVQRLIPSVKAAREAQLAGLFVIERGNVVDEIQLGDREALEILMRNGDDAYGFPPYHTIAGYLYCSDGTDLREAERKIVDQALSGHGASLIRRSNMDWAERIQALVSANGVTVPAWNALQVETTSVAGATV